MRRKRNNPIKSSNWGGKRQKKDVSYQNQRYIHEDALSAQKEIISKAIEVKQELITVKKSEAVLKM